MCLRRSLIMSAPLAPSRPVAGDARKRRGSATAVLAAALLGFFTIMLDAQVVNVALPSIRNDPGGGITGLQWVLDGYTFMFAALLLSAGSLADRFGARRTFGTGIALFIAPSAACGLAWRSSSPRRPPAAWHRTWLSSSRRGWCRARGPPSCCRLRRP